MILVEIDKPLFFSVIVGTVRPVDGRPIVARHDDVD